MSGRSVTIHQPAQPYQPSSAQLSSAQPSPAQEAHLKKQLVMAAWEFVTAVESIDCLPPLVLCLPGRGQHDLRASAAIWPVLFVHNALPTTSF